MVYYTHISEKLQPRRAIACIVIEKEVFRKIQEESTDPSTSLATGSGILLKDVTSSDVTGLVKQLRGQSTKNNLLAAIETRSIFLGAKAGGDPGFLARQS